MFFLRCMTSSDIVTSVVRLLPATGTADHVYSSHIIHPSSHRAVYTRPFSTLVLTSMFDSGDSGRRSDVSVTATQREERRFLKQCPRSLVGDLSDFSRSRPCPGCGKLMMTLRRVCPSVPSQPAQSRPKKRRWKPERTMDNGQRAAEVHLGRKIIGQSRKIGDLWKDSLGVTLDGEGDIGTVLTRYTLKKSEALT